MTTLVVDTAEDGMKLNRFLERRLSPPPPPSALHRWIRTGQVRINGGRVKAFARLHSGDRVRVPPFALAAGAGDTGGTGGQSSQAAPGRSLGGTPSPKPGDHLGSGLFIHALTPDYIVLYKPAGLPAQPGTGHSDSVVHRLQEYFAGSPFIPAPAHRLDKQVSGLLLAGRTHSAQRWLHDLFARRGAGDQATHDAPALSKEYLAWVHGVWPFSEGTVLRDTLHRTHTKLPGARQQGKVRVAPAAMPPPARSHDRPGSPDDDGKEALCRVAPLSALPLSPHGPASLLHVTLYTGRTHQIRVQLASRGCPVIGDVEYGGRAAAGALYLHAWRLRFTSPAQERQEECYSCLPQWPEPFLPPF